MRGLGPVFALLTVASTLVGGYVGLRLRHRLTLAMAFTGGVVLGVALLDVLPESVGKLHAGDTVGLAMAGGFLGFFVLSRLLILHHRDDPEHAAGHNQVGIAGAAALSFHSFLDGFGIGAAFAVSTAIGVAVLIAVVSHDFADGMNTVTFVMSQDGNARLASRWLLVDALAPVGGALVGAAVHVSGHTLGVGLAIYAGIFLSIGAGELLPEAHSETSAARIVLTVAGFLLLFVITRLTAL
ncbi:MAG TPA: permease [Actinobacteria bacterium]|nr:permease [Actinomycetota bacterium]